MRRTKVFLTGLLPLVFSFVIQYSAIFLLLLAGLFVTFCGRRSGINGLFLIGKFMELSSSSDYQTMLMIMYTIIGIVFFGLWYFLRCEGSFGFCCRLSSLPLRVLSYVIMIPGLQFLSGFICSLLAVIAPSLMEEYEQLLDMAGFSQAPSAILLLYSILLAPISEELIFRGVTTRLFQRCFRHFFAANLMQALLFGFFHLNPVQGIYTFVIGLIFGCICYYGGSIWDSILIHILFNLWGTLISDHLDFLPDTVLTDCLLLALIPISLIGGYFLFHCSKKDQG